jgi:hypothetical protein
MGLVFGLICRRLLRACRCAGHAFNGPSKTNRAYCVRVKAVGMTADAYLHVFQTGHRIALAPFIIAQPARIQTQGVL